MKTKIRMDGETTWIPACAAPCQYGGKLPCKFCTEDVKIEVYK